MILLRNKIKKIEYNQKNIDKYKSSTNLLRHARYIPGKTNGVILVDNKDNLVGYIAWEGDYIIALEVTPNYRHKGIATELLNISPSNKLTVSKKNIDAINLYKSLGWVIDEDLGKIYRMILLRNKRYSGTTDTQIDEIRQSKSAEDIPTMNSEMQRAMNNIKK